MAGGYACAMHAAELLGDEDLFAVEDAVADSSFEGSSVATQGEEEEQEQEEEKEEGGNQRVVRLIALSAKVRGSCSVGSGYE